jgi:hypothetical protein
MNDRLTPAFVLRAAFVASALIALPASAQAPAPSTDTTTEASNEPRDPPPPLPADVLKDPKVIAVGEALWKDKLRPLPRLQGLPGKAPKLQPTKYKAEFVWDRVHNASQHAAWKGSSSPRKSSRSSPG